MSKLLFGSSKKYSTKLLSNRLQWMSNCSCLFIMYLYLNGSSGCLTVPFLLLFVGLLRSVPQSVAIFVSVCCGTSGMSSESTVACVFSMFDVDESAGVSSFDSS